MKKLFVILLVGLLVLPLTAQDALTDEQIEQVDYVSNAFAKLTGLLGVRVEGTQMIEQELLFMGQSILQTIEQDISGVITYERRAPATVDLTLVQSTTQDIPGQGEIIADLTMDMRAIEDDLYVRVRDVSMNLLGIYPAGWVNARDGDIPGFELLDPDALLENTLNSQFQIPVTLELVQNISEAPMETLDGVEMRVFDLILDPLAVVESDIIQSTLSVFDADAMGVDMNDLLTQMAQGMTYSLSVWIDPNTDFINQVTIRMDIDTEISMLGETFDLIQMMTGTSRYSDFDEVFEIEVPDTSDF